MELNFEFSYKPLVSQDIEAFENEYGINLPENYKRFLLLNNGGKPVKEDLRQQMELLRPQ